MLERTKSLLATKFSPDIQRVVNMERRSHVLYLPARRKSIKNRKWQLYMDYFKKCNKIYNDKYISKNLSI